MDERPLVAITRPEDRSAGLAALLREAGFEPLLVPAIRRREPASWAALDAALVRLAQGAYDGLLFTSPAAVAFFHGRMRQLGLRAPEVIVGAVGAGTAAALEEVGLHAAIVPEREDGVGLAAAVIDHLGPAVARMRFLQPRAAEGRTELAAGLVGAGAAVEVVDTYRTELASAEELAPLAAALERGRVGALVFASPSAVRAVHEALGLPVRVPAVAIGATTAAALQAAGALQIEVAARADDRGLLAAIRAALPAAD